MNRFVIFVCLTLLLFSCSKNNNPVNTIEFGDLTDAVFLSSFESNGDPTISGWQVPLQLPAKLLSFSRDVPIGGGYWSLNIRGTKGSDLKVEIKSRTTLVDSDSLASYVLTFWAKGKGYAALVVGDSNAGWYNSVPVNASSWTLFADTVSRHQLRFNTLEVWLDASMDDSLSSIYFDNIKVVKRRF